MRAAYHLARRSLPTYSNKFSRKDFTLPQLFACLTVKEMLRRSYRSAEALLADCDNWLRDVGLTKAPDHNTLCRAAKLLLGRLRVRKLLDRFARWAVTARLMNLSRKPLAIDSSSYESHHVSRHYERRCRQTRRRMTSGGDAKRPGKTGRSETIRRLPKIAVGVATHSHLVLSLWTGTGGGSDHPHFEPALLDAWRRVPNRRRFAVACDAGYDSERNHQLARQEMRLRTLIPAEIGRPLVRPGATLAGRWRRVMKKLLSTKSSRKRSGYTSRWQSETVHSMMKRNLGSALSGKTAHSRKRDLHLKAITHDLMVF
jgi:Transposase DDE domain